MKIIKKYLQIYGYNNNYIKKEMIAHYFLLMKKSHLSVWTNCVLKTKNQMSILLFLFPMELIIYFSYIH